MAVGRGPRGRGRERDGGEKGGEGMREGPRERWRMRGGEGRGGEGRGGEGRGGGYSRNL